jgi:hypothetical protein
MMTAPAAKTQRVPSHTGSFAPEYPPSLFRPFLG